MNFLKFKKPHLNVWVFKWEIWPKLAIEINDNPYFIEKWDDAISQWMFNEAKLDSAFGQGCYTTSPHKCVLLP